MKKIFLIVFILFMLVGVLLFKFINDNNTILSKQKKEEEILSRFHNDVVTNKETIVYEYNGDKYTNVGRIAKNTQLKLVKEGISEYFKLDNSGYYVHYLDVNKTFTPQKIDKRYKDYIVWNENVITKPITKFYDENNNLILTINKSFELPIIIKETEKYGVEFNDSLYFIKDIEKTIPKENNVSATRSDIRTLTYHTVYDPQTQKCTSIEICHPIKQFEEQMQYLSDNKYLTLTLQEVEMFLDKKIRIPLKSIAITLDDGIFLENSIPIVEKYGIYATFFIITSKTDINKYANSKYAKFESHSDDLHNNYRCPKNREYSQGGQMLCEKEEVIIADLKLSQKKLNGSNYFAYPFFDFNDRAINALKKADFRMAFIGQWDTNGYSTYDTNRYMLRRKTVFGNLKLDNFIDYLK